MDYVGEGMAKGFEIVQCGMIASGAYCEIGSTRMVDFMLRTNFTSFVKGPAFRNVYHELLGQGIFATDGDIWRHHRKMSAFMFSQRVLTEHMLAVFIAHAYEVIAKLDKLAVSGEAIDMQELFYFYTLDCISEIAFGVQLHCLTANSQPQFASSFDAAQECCNLRWFVPPMITKLKRAFNIGSEGALKKHICVIDEVMNGLVDARLAADPTLYQDSPDLLSLYLNHHAKHTPTEVLDRKYLRDVVLNFMIAGRGQFGNGWSAKMHHALRHHTHSFFVFFSVCVLSDTTAIGLTYLFFELAAHPKEEEIVSAHLSQHPVPLGEETKGLTADTLVHPSLNRLEAAWEEGLRLHPPIAMETKRVLTEVTFPDGTTLQPKVQVGYAPYVVNRMKENWGEDAQVFKAERWLAPITDDAPVAHDSIREKGPVPSSAQFLSFNHGPRICLGKAMAYQVRHTRHHRIMMSAHRERR